MFTENGDSTIQLYKSGTFLKKMGVFTNNTRGWFDVEHKSCHSEEDNLPQSHLEAFAVVSRDVMPPKFC